MYDSKPALTGANAIAATLPDNGNTVPIAIEVEGRFSAERYVKAIHVFAEDNPAPEVISFVFTPASGRAWN